MAGRVAMAGVGLTMALGTFMVMAPPANAYITPTGSCTGEGTFTKGAKGVSPGPYAAEKMGKSDVVIVPLSDDVKWSGSVAAGSVPRAISGFVAVKLPWPFSSFTVDSWHNPSSTTVDNHGTKHYKLPSILPRDTIFQVYGAHVEPGVNCAGFVLLKIEGSAFDTPLTAIFLALTVAFFLLFLALGRARAGA
jgi:hypothetical protein